MSAQAVLLATTILYRERFAETPYTEHPFPSDVETVMAADELTEFAARSVNESWDRPNPNTATNRAYMRALIVREYYSAMEHASATFWITGISASLARDLTSHSGLSYSQLSQGQTDNTTADFVLPPAYRHSEDAHNAVDDAFDFSLEVYESLMERGLANGLSVKEAREAARCVLPNCTETTLVVTGNLRTWRDVIDKRNSERADAEIRELSQELLRQLKDVAPNAFQDMTIRGPRSMGVSVLASEEDWEAANPTLSDASGPLQLSATLRVA